MARNLISMTDLTYDDVEKIYDLARDVKNNPEGYRKVFRGRSFGLIFEKPSTRTWVSFEAGIFGMGGAAIYLGPQDLELGKREEIKDVARVLSRYLEAVVLRTFSHTTITEFAQYFSNPVLNGLSDLEHPCQVLSDYFTICEKFPDDSNPKIVFIGDGNNVLHSLIRLTAILGARLHYATPKTYEPSPEILKEALAVARKTGGEIRGFHDPAEAVDKADVVYTDVWVSMGEESLADSKMKAFQGMQLNGKLMKKAKKNALVMHCLPAHRGQEITDEVMESPNSVIFEQAENRLHVQKAILLHLCERSKDSEG
ncbi:MAG: ornithine carbamoyltransferase [Candidatus Omnitrophota bacterium]|jgi:ornithine carbamoyltransferase